MEKLLDNFCEWIAHYAKVQPNKVALIDRDKEVTYERLYALVKGFCGYLKNNHVQKGDAIVCRASATIEYWVAFSGTLLAGCVFVPLEKDCTQEKIQSIIAQFNSVFAVISNDEDEQNEFNCKQFINNKQIIKLANENVEEGVEYPFPTYEDDAVILFTTGTTGKSKGVIIQQKYLIESAYRSKQICYSNDMVIVMPVPMNHVFGVGRSITALIFGATVILLDGMANLKPFFYALSEQNANAMAVAPSALNYILALLGEEIAEYFTNIRFIEIGGEKMPYALQESLVKLLPNTRLYNVYASTESGVSCIYEFSKYGPTQNRIGTPIDKTEILFTDENGGLIAATKDNPGGIAVKSTGMMRCYWGDEAATNSIKQGDVIYMSDYGYVDEEGFVCLLGRKGDVIICGGQKVNPTEVEDCMSKSGLVVDCVCFGVKDEIFGNKVCLNVVMKEGIAYDEGQIKGYLTDNLEYFKVPKEVARVEAIQRNKNGKIDRKYYTK